MSSKITKNGYATNDFSLELLAIFLLMLRKQLFCEFSLSCGEMSFLKKGSPSILTYG
jgi:hypothetical protein